MGIIGVVASITIPQVIANYTKKVTVNKLKKNYAIIQQAIKRSEIDNESVQSWDTSLSGHEFFERYIKDYFANATEIAHSKINTKVMRKNLNGTPYQGFFFSDSRANVNFLINDGSMIAIHITSAGIIIISVDINGLAEPNTLGKDTFIFLYHTKSGLRAYGDSLFDVSPCSNCTREKLLGTESDKSCNKQNLGHWCALLIMNDGWEIRKDYPW